MLAYFLFLARSPGLVPSCCSRLRLGCFKEKAVWRGELWDQAGKKIVFLNWSFSFDPSHAPLSILVSKRLSQKHVATGYESADVLIQSTDHLWEWNFRHAVSFIKVTKNCVTRREATTMTKTDTGVSLMSVYEALFSRPHV